MTPQQAEELSTRLAVCRPQDRVRGAMFNAILQLVHTRLGAEARDTARAQLAGTGAFKDLASYPVSDFLKLLFTSADLLSAHGGAFDDEVQACGEADVLAFANSSVGGLFFGLMSLANPSPLVTYGQRRWEQQGEANGVLHMEGDMQPPRYHVGVIVAGLRSLGYVAHVRVNARTLTACDYEISWTKA